MEFLRKYAFLGVNSGRFARPGLQGALAGRDLEERYGLHEAPDEEIHRLTNKV